MQTMKNRAWHITSAQWLTIKLSYFGDFKPREVGNHYNATKIFIMNPE